MAGLNNVTIIPGQGGLGRPAAGQDYLSGIIFYSDTIPSGFTSNVPQQVLSLNQAVSLGILNNYSDETAAACIVTVGAVATDGDVVSIYVQEPVNNVLLGTYTKVSTDTTEAEEATAITAAININTTNTGYTAVASTDTVIITARPGLGLFLNGTSATASGTGSGDFTLTLGEFGAGGSAVVGAASLLIQWYYHIEEYYRLNPTGNLWVLFNTITDNTWNFQELTTIQAAASGSLRQVGIYLGNVSHFSDAADVVTICNQVQTVATALNTNNNTPLSVVVGSDLSTVSNFTTLHNLGNLSDNRVSYTVSQDGTINQDGSTGLGYAIFVAQGYSITDVGSLLGTISASAVNQDQAWVAQFNQALSGNLYSSGQYVITYENELATPAFSNGSLINTITDLNLLIQLSNYRYLFLVNLNGIAGTYWEDNPTAISASSDYAYINDNRTFDKASRGVRTALLPYLNSPLILNPNGTLTDTTIAILTAAAQVPLDQMVNASEISAYLVNNITYDQSTNTIVLNVRLLPDGVARNIIVNMGFTTSIS